ncbi:hypothetical protein IEQ34_014643 [Dendrobium chrysotoxum]|uniref:HMA domain-containing protein n=1 Tax=Dendrobium chrysotoxum TaxID=161865 RepID=A0AAV7GJM6_DENCH|nr:hypothetical protein IEQ34_014643 [Dendrobium chrysotoxum]
MRPGQEICGFHLFPFSVATLPYRCKTCTAVTFSHPSIFPSARARAFYSPIPSISSAFQIPTHRSNDINEQAWGRETERETANEKQAMGTEAKGEEKEKKAEGEKKDFSGKVDGPIIVVLKVEMHCEGCAQKVRRSVKGLKVFAGVQAAASDILESKLTVIGKVNPLELRGHVESKTHKKVELISPAIAVKKEESSKAVKKEESTKAVKKEESSKAEGNVGAKTEKPDKDKDQKNADGNRPNEPSATSVVLKIRLHCKGCIQRIKKQIYKIKGVDSVSVDSEKDLVTVNGTMNVTNLPGFLMAKLRREVEVVNLKKNEDGDKEKNEKKDNGDAGKKEGQVTAAAAEATAALATVAMDAAAIAAAMDGSKMDYYVGAYGFYPYRMEVVQAPQLFSDENPNACSIM